MSEKPVSELRRRMPWVVVSTHPLVVDLISMSPS
jgi:hypothetical protein